MKKKWKLIFALIITFIIILIIAQQYSQGLEAKLLKMQPRSIAQTFKEDGVVVADQEHPVYTTYGGKIIALPIKEGQRVEKGQLLVSFDSQEAQYQSEQLQGQLRSIQAQQELEREKISLDKLRLLYEAGALSKKEFEDAQNTVNSQYYPGQIDSLAAQINLMEHRIAESSLYAPANGVVTFVDNVKEGMVMAPGQPVLSLIENDKYTIETYVLTADASSIKQGMKVSLIQDNKDSDVVFGGTLDNIAPIAVEKTSSLGLVEQRIKVTIIPDVPKELALRPGYSLDVEFTTDQQENCLVVPKTVLFPYQGYDALWVVRDEKAQIQPVQKGFENDREVVISEGLKDGDLVVLNPQLPEIAEGKKIVEIE